MLVRKPPAERSFRADRSAPRAAAAWFRENAAAEAAGLPPQRLALAELCLDELVSNIVRYGGESDHQVMFTVSLQWEREPDTLLLTVEDDGREFDPRQTPPPFFASSLDEAPEGGRGVFLIRSIADELRYERQPGRNRVTLLFRIPA
jgi:serine/threonine-protein kinase RsbW